jgi:hypothetical protein
VPLGIADHDGYQRFVHVRLNGRSRHLRGSLFRLLCFRRQGGRECQEAEGNGARWAENRAKARMEIFLPTCRAELDHGFEGYAGGVLC